MNIYEKLTEARALLDARDLRKTGENKYSGFSYFELSDFMPAIKELFKDLKMCSEFSINADNTAHLHIINAEKPEEVITFSSPAVVANIKGASEIQAIGGAHTYMKRYLYLNALEIVENDAIDATSGATVNSNQKAGVKKAVFMEINAINDIDSLNAVYKKVSLLDDYSTLWREVLAVKVKALNAKFDKIKSIFLLQEGATA